MTYSKSKIKYRYALIFLVFVFCLTSCLTTPNNDKADKNFENEFIENIKQDNAKTFDFQHDVLTPQKSYFVDNKLKYLTFRNGPEVGFVECRLTFDLSTGSIEKYTMRQVLPNYQKSGDERKVFDTIFVFYPKRHNSETYYANKLIDTTFRQDMFNEQIPFINEVKSSTQKEFNSRQHGVLQ